MPNWLYKTLYELSHSIVVLIAGLIGFIFGYADIFAGSMTVFFIGRELTQAEYRWIKWFGLGKRENMPWWAIFDYRVWDVHSLFFNTILPIFIYFMFIMLKN